MREEARRRNPELHAKMMAAREKLRAGQIGSYTKIMQATGVEERNGGYYVACSRVSLDSVIYAYLRGESLEGIVESFPALSLEQVSGAVNFYLANRPFVENYLCDQARKEELMYDEARSQDPEFYQKLEDARKRTPSLIA